MIEQKPSTIEEAPSLADIKSAKDDRLGRVDFTAQLGTGDEDDAVRSDDGSVVSLSSMARPARPSAVEGEEGAARLPFILPPAKVDEAMAAEAQRARRAIAEARGEVIVADDLDAEHDDIEDSLAEPETTAGTMAGTTAGTTDAAMPVVEEPAAVETAAVEATVVEPVGKVPVVTPVVEAPAPVESTKRSFLRRKPEPEAPSAPAPGGSGEGLMIQGVASLDEMAAAVAAQEAALTAAAEEAERVAAAERAESEAAAAAEAQALARLGVDVDDAPVENLDDLLDDDLDAYDELDDYAPPASTVSPVHAVGVPVASEAATPDQAVAEVAESVIALMRSTQDAHQRHLESVELEAARRCELLTAQAELDAELIRLHARREAHAIVSAARMRVGAEPTRPPESDQISEIGETFSRFAETIETTVAFGPASPNETRKS